MKLYKKVLLYFWVLAVLTQIWFRSHGFEAESRTAFTVATLLGLVLIALTEKRVEIWVEKQLNLDDPSDRDPK